MHYAARHMHIQPIRCFIANYTWINRLI